MEKLSKGYWGIVGIKGNNSGDKEVTSITNGEIIVVTSNNQPNKFQQLFGTLWNDWATAVCEGNLNDSFQFLQLSDWGLY